MDDEDSIRLDSSDSSSSFISDSNYEESFRKRWQKDSDSEIDSDSENLESSEEEEEEEEEEEDNDDKTNEDGDQESEDEVEAFEYPIGTTGESNHSVEFDPPADILAENNNDPNNNMDSLEIQINDEGESGETNSRTVVPTVSPQPGCSSHFDQIENFVNSNSGPNLHKYPQDIIEDSKEILAITKHLTLESICHALLQNRKSNNILYSNELLPVVINFYGAQKRKNDNDICKTEVKKIALPSTAGPSTFSIMNFPGKGILPMPETMLEAPENKESLQPLSPASYLSQKQNSKQENMEKEHPSQPSTSADPIVRPSTFKLLETKIIPRIKALPPAVDPPISLGAVPKSSLSNHQLKELGVNKVSGSNKVALKRPATLIAKNSEVAQNHSSESTHVAFKEQPLQHQERDFFQKHSRELTAKQLRNQIESLHQKVILSSKPPVIQPHNASKTKVVFSNKANQQIHPLSYNVEKSKDNPVIKAIPIPPRSDPQVVRPPTVIEIPADPAPPALPKLPHNGDKKISKEIYVKLRAMFPNIRRSYIKRFCPENWMPNVPHDNQFAQIVETLFSKESEWEINMDIPDVDGNAGNQPNVDEVYQNLIELFPKAELGYMRTIAEKYYLSEDQLENYINQHLQNPSYPTREQYLAQLKITEEQKRFTTNFDINYFLEIFPDPKKYFEDPNKICHFDAVAFDCLKSIFKNIRVNTIRKVYKDSKYNMSIAARSLYGINRDMATTRSGSEYPTTKIPLLQEMAYAKHLSEIEKYLAEKEKKEKKDFQCLKDNNQLLECQCCFDSECMPSKCSSCDNGHIFCNSCIINGTDSRLGDGETHVQCFMGCGSEFSLSTLQKILKPTNFSILLKKRQAAEVVAAGLEGLVSCPFCHFATIPPEGDKVFKCLNLECMKDSCIQCKEPSHIPLRCDEVGKADKNRKYLEEKLTQALSRVCYNCKKLFIKEEGCNKITCPCGAMMCYLCDKQIKDYDHFRGQGSNDIGKCPLYSDNSMLNYQTVKKVAEEVKKQLLEEDPTLIIDIEPLLPPKPRATNGPHQQIVGGPSLAEIHAARVLGQRR